MRGFVFAIFALISLISGAANALDMEERKTFPATSSLSSSLRILSTADLDIFEPIIQAFQESNATLSIEYTVASSSDVYQEIAKGSDAYDLVISSAMDLQLKLVNDGYAQRHIRRPSITNDGGHWGSQVFAFTQEPAVLLVSKKAFGDLQIPRTRQDLLRVMRQAPDQLRGKIGTYDLSESGVGYLLATQDIRRSETFWQLVELFGSLDAKLYCCSGQMIDDILKGNIAIAYNVLGSYADLRLSENKETEVIWLEDYTHILLRSALIPRTSAQPDLAGRFIDFLISSSTHSVIERSGLPPFDSSALRLTPQGRPIPFSLGLLVFLDKQKTERTLETWSAAFDRGG